MSHDHTSMLLHDAQDFQKCGVIMVAPKRNAFAMSCMYCCNMFTRLPAFMRHLQQRHMEELHFENKMEVYAVEELVNRTLRCFRDMDSEESGVAEDDCISEYEEDRDEEEFVAKQNNKDAILREDIPARTVLKKGPLKNSALLKALRDCDVSFDFVQNLDSTINEDIVVSKTEKYEENVDQKQEYVKNADVNEGGMEMEDDDLDMDSTILKRIQMELEEEEDITNQEQINHVTKHDGSINASKKNVATVMHTKGTLFEDNKKPSHSKACDLKNLLSGLDDLEDVDVDDLLNNFEDSIVSKHFDLQAEETHDDHCGDAKEKILEFGEEDLEDFDLNASILRQCLADNLEDEVEIGEMNKSPTLAVNYKKGKHERGGCLSNLNLQAMAEWGLDDIDLEACIQVSEEADDDDEDNGQVLCTVDSVLNEKSKEKSICFNKDLLEITPKTSMIYEESMENSEMATESEFEAAKENSEIDNEQNTSLLLTLNAIEASIKSPRTPPKFYTEVVEESSYEVEQKYSEAFETGVSCKALVKNSGGKNRGSPKVMKGTPKSFKTVVNTRLTSEMPNFKKETKPLSEIVKTPRTSKTSSNKINAIKKFHNDVLSPREKGDHKTTQNLRNVIVNSSKATNKCIEEFNLVEIAADISKDTSKKTPRGRKDKHIVNSEKSYSIKESEKPNNQLPKLTITEIAAVPKSPLISEEEKEFETNKFDEGLTEEKSSTRLFEEINTDSAETKHFWKSLINKDLDDDDDMDTLIHELENNTNACRQVDICKKIQNEADINTDVLEEVTNVFKKFDKFDSTIVAAANNEDEQNEEDDFERLLNEDLSKALEDALGEENINLFLDENVLPLISTIEDDAVQSIQKTATEVKENNSPQLHKVKKILARNKSKKEDKIRQEYRKKVYTLRQGKTTIQFSNKYSKTNQRAKYVLGKRVKNEQSSALIQPSGPVDVADSVLNVNHLKNKQNLKEELQNTEVSISPKKMLSTNIVNSNTISLQKPKIKDIENPPHKLDSQNELKHNIENTLSENILNSNNHSLQKAIIKDSQSELKHVENTHSKNIVNSNTISLQMPNIKDIENSPHKLDSQNKLKHNTENNLSKNIVNSNTHSLQKAKIKDSQNELKHVENTYSKNIVNSNTISLQKPKIKDIENSPPKVDSQNELKHNTENTPSKNIVNSNTFSIQKTKTKNIENSPPKVDSQNEHKRNTENTPSKNIVNSNTLSIQKKLKHNTENSTSKNILNSNSLLLQMPQKKDIENSPPTADSRNELKHRAEQQSSAQIKQCFEKNISAAAKCFINMQRGERTPLKLEELFKKQSPSSKADQVCNIQQKTPDNNVGKKSLRACKKNINKTMSPPQTNIKTSPTNQIEKSSTQKLHKSLEVLHGVDNTQNSHKLRNFCVKMQRWPSVQNLNNFESISSHEEVKSSQNVNSPPHLTFGKKQPLHETKLSNEVTISKINTSHNSTIDEITPTKSYCKQNFTEKEISGLHQSLHSATKALISGLPKSITVTKSAVSSIEDDRRVRARQASIDCAPEAKSSKKSDLDYKSYVVNRSERKKLVMKRMRTIKKQIFKSVDSSAKVVKSPLPLRKKRQGSLIDIKEIRILPNVKKENLTPLMESPNASPQMTALQDDHIPQTTKNCESNENSELPSKAYKQQSPKQRSPKQRSPKQRSPKQRSPKQRSPKQRSPKQRSPKQRSPKQLSPKQVSSKEAPPKQVSSKTTPPKQDIIPNGAKTPTNSPDKTNVLKTLQAPQMDDAMEQKSSNLRTTCKTPQSAQALRCIKQQVPSTPIRSAKPSAKTPTGKRSLLKRQATSPLEEEECPKRVNKSKDVTQDKLKPASLSDGITNNELMPEDDLSLDKTPKKTDQKEHQNSVQNDSDESKKIDGNCNKWDVVAELYDQVQKEKSTSEIKTDDKEQVSSFRTNVEDYNDSKDENLLKKFGLNIIMIDNIEDFHTIEEVENMRSKAKQFADICGQYKRLYICSKLTNSFELLHNFRAHINSTFNENISTNDVKRLVNLLVIWYTNCYNNKLIEKKPFSESTNYYLLTFHCIPKTTKRTYYCEFCDDNFTSEPKYYAHRIQHTGAKFPYMCKNCPQGFQRAIGLKNHAVRCGKQTNKEIKQQKEPVTRMNHNNVNNSQQVKKVNNSNTNLLGVKTVTKSGNNETKSMPVNPRLNTIYKCCKCHGAFTTYSEIANHVVSCNRSQRQQLKATPRPKPKV